MKRLRHSFICGLSILLATASLSAQVKIGDNPAVLNSNAALEIQSTNKGLLLPRLALTGTANATPLLAHIAGMTVYNTATVADVSPGFYLNDGTQWVKTATTGDPWQSQGNSVFLPNNNKNVGIGTNTPSAKLSVIGNSTPGSAAEIHAIGDGNGWNTAVAGRANTATVGVNIGLYGNASNGAFGNYAIWGEGNSFLNGKVYLLQPGNNASATTPWYGLGMNGLQVTHGGWGGHAFYTGGVGPAIPALTIEHFGNVGIVGNLSIGNSVAAQAKLDVNGYIKVGTADATADNTPTVGLIRYNSTINKFQGYDGTSWVDLH